MKTIHVLIFFIIFYFYADNIFGITRQVSYRWRNNDGDVYTATWKDSVNTPVILTDKENLRLRIQIIADNNPWDLNMFLTYSEGEYNDFFIPMTMSDTGKFCISASQYLSDINVLTDNQMLSCPDAIYKYQKTVTFDSTNNYGLNNSQGYNLYEFEYSIKPTVNIKPGAVYFFTITMGTESLLNGENAVLMTSPVSWFPQPFGNRVGYYHYNFTDLAFFDSNNGTIVGHVTTSYNSSETIRNFILKTTNGGLTWIEPTYPAEPNSYLEAVCFTSADTEIAFGNNGTILKTTNGGKDWVQQNIGITGDLHSVCFTDKNTGNVIGGDTLGNFYLRTTDGGMSWAKYYFQIKNTYLEKVYFLNAKTGYIVGGTNNDNGYPYGIVLKTTNSGLNWDTLSTGAIKSFSYYDIFFTDVNNGYIAGDGVIIKTTNSGSTWMKSYESDGPRMYSLYFNSKNTGWAVGEGGWILKTTDGGLKWDKLVSGTLQTLHAVQFIGEKTGWVVGTYGKILKTTTGGIATSVEEKIQKSIPERFYLSQNYPNPFNSSTKIKYSIPKTSFSSIIVYDILGKEVAMLVNEEKPAGNYEIKWNTVSLQSGVYFYQIRAGDFIKAKKMVLLR